MGNELTINPKTVYSELQKLKPQIESALPRHMTPDRMARIALTQLRVNPNLFNCTPESFYGAIIAASQLGLEPGVNGQCYLVPYKNTCTLVPGWKGLMDLVSRAGRASAWTGVVRSDDFFEFKLGSNPKLLHEPGDEDLGEFTHVYAIGWVKDAQWPIIEVWSRAKVVKHLKQYNKVGDRHYALANENNLEMYGRKVALLQVIKYLPSSVELRDATALDVAAGEGKQALTIDMALNNDLTGGGPSEALAEMEALMVKLGWPDDKRNSFRETYATKADEGVLYLQEELKKAGRDTRPAPGAQTTTGRQRGGGKSEPAKEADTTSSRSTPVSDGAPSTTSDSEAQTSRTEPAKEEKQQGSSDFNWMS